MRTNQLFFLNVLIFSTCLATVDQVTPEIQLTDERIANCVCRGQP
jgi:hypothetical protein